MTTLQLPPLGRSTLVISFKPKPLSGPLHRCCTGAGRSAGDDQIVVAHALDTAQSGFMTDPTTGDYDGGAWWDASCWQSSARRTVETRTHPWQVHGCDGGGSALRAMRPVPSWPSCRRLTRRAGGPFDQPPRAARHSTLPQATRGGGTGSQQDAAPGQGCGGAEAGGAGIPESAGRGDVARDR